MNCIRKPVVGSKGKHGLSLKFLVVAWAEDSSLQLRQAWHGLPLCGARRDDVCHICQPDLQSHLKTILFSLSMIFKTSSFSCDLGHLTVNAGCIVALVLWFAFGTSMTQLGAPGRSTRRHLDLEVGNMCWNHGCIDRPAGPTTVRQAHSCASDILLNQKHKQGCPH